MQAQDAFVALPNVGPKLTPNYETTVGATAVTKATAEGGKVFAGPRQDAFFIDLGAAVDKLSIRDLDSRGNVGNKGGGVNTLAGFNCDAIAIQVPISTPSRSGSPPMSSRPLGPASCSGREINAEARRFAETRRDPLSKVLCATSASSAPLRFSICLVRPQSVPTSTI